jgi:hypothetical protein
MQSPAYTDENRDPLLGGGSLGLGRVRNDLLAGASTVDAHIVDWKGERRILFVFGVSPENVIFCYSFARLTTQ